MTTNVPMLNQAAPQYAVVAKGSSSMASALLGGVGGGGVKRLSIKQSRWRIYEGSEEVAVKNDPHIDVAIVRANPNINKQFFIKNYTPGQEAEAPDCYSHDGITPAAGAANKQCDSCANCPQNVWGSKISPTGAKIKACADRKLVAVKFADQMLDEDADIYRLAIPGASLKDFGNAVRQIVTKGVDPAAVVFRIGFDLQAEFPKLTFAPVRYMTADEYAIAKEDEQSTDAMYATTEMDNGPVAAAPAAKQADPLGEPPAAAQTTQAAASTSRRRAPQAESAAQPTSVAGAETATMADQSAVVVEQQQAPAATTARRRAPAQTQPEVVVDPTPAPDIASDVVVANDGGSLAAALETEWDD